MTTAKPAQAQKSAPASPRRGATVTVACKFPAGLILQLCKAVETYEPVMGGGGSRKVVVHNRVGPEVHLRGTAEPQGQVPKGYIRPQIEGGYALTHGVDADFWEQWLEQNKDTDLVIKKTVFAASDLADVRAEARENEKVFTGFEPIEPDNDRRIPKPATAALEPIKTADLRA